MTDTISWTADDASRARLREVLEERGYALLRPDPAQLSPELAANDPWEAATRLWGEPPELIERQPIAAVPWGRSFASTSGVTPLHTDSQLYAGAPPDLQLMFCARPADRGGETTLLDTWPLLSAIERTDPGLFHALLHAPRRIPFVFGDVVGPTVSLRRGSVVFTQSPMAAPGDPLAERLRPHLDRADLTQVRPAGGDVLVVDNHRMLHGRTAFEDVERSFTRLLLWLLAPLPCPAPLREALRSCARAADAAACRVAGAGAAPTRAANAGGARRQATAHRDRDAARRAAGRARAPVRCARTRPLRLARPRARGRRCGARTGRRGRRGPRTSRRCDFVMLVSSTSDRLRRKPFRDVAASTIVKRWSTSTTCPS